MPCAFSQTLRVCLLHHHLAEVDADEVVLENVVIEHVFGGFTEIHDPLGQGRWLHAVGHVLCITEQVAWLSPQMPQMRLVMKWASRGSLFCMKML